MKKIAALISCLILTSCSQSHANWRDADRSSADLAPKAEKESGAVVQIYTARTYNWHKVFAVHSWVAFKEKNDDSYQVFHVIGWQVRRGGDAIRATRGLSDRKWYGNTPTVINDLRGEMAEKAIPQIKAAIKSYPYQKAYRLYPGPNSNSFVSYVIRNVDQLQVELPPTAIGKDWIDDGDLVGWSESGTGVQFSLFGMLGVTLGVAEGIEVNILGLSFGVDIMRPALKLPMIGRIGFPDGPVF